ncbi:hypothetical protein H6F93_01900 [Leptolyngbya sp. FACHB-671]|uniref:hypothetical protein n=1 Tax=Leptolyngbya sp. FACHB-671 TaxID=2692812 RepID=UPI0016834D92|nr:hypothetical protein [Leptolyngbya sp. FACHB-671]MBD2066291.1 hypothetical protein [Leptolyngbya sp. FACHB-671]
MEDAEFKLTVAAQQPTVNTATIYDRRQEENLKFWHRFQAAQQVEDARQALGFSTAQPEDWKRRQALEDSIVETASKLVWLPAQATAFQKSSLGLPVDSQLCRAEMTAEQLQKVADAFAAALKEKQTEKRRQAALNRRAAS